MNINRIIKIIILAAVVSYKGYAQQDPQYTHYSYNTMTVNPAYTGSRGHLTVLSLYRSQWVGIEGSPQTITFSIDAPLGIADGIGLSLVQDNLGPSSETYIDGNYAHQLILNSNGDKLAFGVKAGVRFFSVDWSKGTYRDPDTAFNENINSRVLPSIGAGAFYYTDKFYLGFSTPNVLTNQHYDEIKEAEATERVHLFFITGYVFDLSENLKFKPSVFVKQVMGAPIAADVSANFLINESFTLGLNYRWDDSVSGLFGIQISPKFNVGYAYDYNTSNLNNYNSGTHEIFLSYRLISNIKAMKSPRFF